jgi:hypothetical protein
MCIYCGTTKYRKIYENHHGSIPKDEDGRSYDVHHIDKNRRNNDPANLKAVSMKEHYDIHKSQGDWGACLRLSGRLQIPQEEKSKMATDHNNKRVIEGTHPFLGGEIQRNSNLRRVANGSNPFLGGALSRKINHERVSNKTHNFLGATINRIRIENGTHQNLIKLSCPHCGKIGQNAAMKRWHFDRCKTIQKSSEATV